MNASEAYELYIRVVTVYGYTKVTIYDYRRELYRFYSYCTEIKGTNWSLVDTTPLEIHEYIAKCKDDGRSAASINRSRDALSSIFQALMVRGMIEKNPVKAVKHVRSATLERAHLDEETACQLIDAIDNPMVQMAVRLMYYTGIRVSELTTLSIFHVDLNAGVLKVLGKGRKQREIPLDEKGLQPYLSEYINRYLKGRDPYTRLFQIEQTGMVSPTTINRVLFEASRKIGTNVRITAHILRHSFATKYLYAGGHLHELQYLLGHNQLETTAKYVHAKLKSIKLTLGGEKGNHA